ncbi:MAG TPA: hypothetical protein VGF48_06070 [Thermoanaerobaculia bacterium]|jgi:predicted anti-sigma-YlaC factor YlaD
MNPNELCPREDELLDALGRGFLGEELESHAAACASCSELHLVAGALLQERTEAIVEAPIRSSGTMWWRMQLRRRHDAVARARRSLLIGQAATLLVAVTLVVSFFGRSIAVGVRELVSTMHVSTPLLLVLAAWVLAAPIAGWVVVRQK